MAPEAGGQVFILVGELSQNEGCNAKKTVSWQPRAMTLARVPTCCALSTVSFGFLLEVEQFLDAGAEDLCDVPGQLE